MAKVSSRFVCHSCGYESLKYMGRCPGCGEWNSLVEESSQERTAALVPPRAAAVELDQVADNSFSRLPSGMLELDRVLGGGMVPGSLILLGGDPGIGKSTLLLQVAGHVAAGGSRVLYLSGEESLGQIKLRASRLQVGGQGIFLLGEQHIERLEHYLDELDPDVVIIDSIQTVYSDSISSIPGSVSQLRECTARIMKLAKNSRRAFFLIGHVTKEGALAGPKVLEHMVDVVINFEGERTFSFRILRSVKNRFGSTDEIGLLEMSGLGLVEVQDPSHYFLTERDSCVSGSAVVASFEGSRPLLLEIQALAVPSAPGYPRRMASGIDQNRLALIIAVLEKNCGHNLSQHDIYVKVSGGVFLKDPSVDLGIAAAIMSSCCNKPLRADMVFAGELALSGEIRPVPFLEQRIKEVEKMGYGSMVVPAVSDRRQALRPDLEIREIRRISEFTEAFMGE